LDSKWKSDWNQQYVVIVIVVGKLAVESGDALLCSNAENRTRVETEEEDTHLSKLRTNDSVDRYTT